MLNLTDLPNVRFWSKLDGRFGWKADIGQSREAIIGVMVVSAFIPRRC
jgi:hypothetical protein